ncbi:MAG: LPS assembly lipoprotein LptE [Hylemonella sp.]|nr:LPS assembly lipoprotein LptE [Hylemonella sp.]
MKRRLPIWLLCALALALAGCGFGLRQPVSFAFNSLYSGVAPNSPMGVELKRQLQSSGQLEYITDAARQQEAQAVLDILSERRVKTVVGVSATGQVREFQLRLILKFRLRTPQGKELIPETELVQQRALSYDEVFALAKEAEEVLLYRNMQSDMVQQILRRLAAVKEL